MLVYLAAVVHVHDDATASIESRHVALLAVEVRRPAEPLQAAPSVQPVVCPSSRGAQKVLQLRLADTWRGERERETRQRV